MSIAIASIIVLVVVGALGGLLLFRVLGRAAARNENQPGGGDAEAGNPEGLREETRRSVWHFVGMGAAGSAILVSLAAIITAFSRAQEFQNDAAGGSHIVAEADTPGLAGPTFNGVPNLRSVP